MIPVEEEFFCNITWYCSPLIQLSYAIIYHIYFIFLFQFTFSLYLSLFILKIIYVCCEIEIYILNLHLECLSEAAIKMGLLFSHKSS